MSTTEPRVWIGCLACYNDGKLRGQWYDATDAASVTTEQLHADGKAFAGEVLGSVFEVHEELWVMDHEGFGGLLDGECSPDTAQGLADLIEEVERRGYPIEAYAAYLSNLGENADADSFEAFEEAYAGEWPSREDYAENLADDLGLVDSEASWPNNYIDWERAARDLFLGDYWDAKSPDHAIYVFRSY